MKGRMKRKGNSSSEASDLQVFLFDHYLVFAKIRYEDHLEYYKTYRRVSCGHMITFFIAVFINIYFLSQFLLNYYQSTHHIPQPTIDKKEQVLYYPTIDPSIISTV